MREILFRGKYASNSGKFEKWFEGGFSSVNGMHPHKAWIIPLTGGNWIPIIPETVGQFTGLLDKNGKRIFEGDVVQCDDERELVKFLNDGYRPGYRPFVMPYDHLCWAADECEIIGNVHDNPELLEEPV